MILHNEPSFLIYFGDARDRCVKSGHLFNPEYLKELKEKLNLEKLIFLKQTHGIEGQTLTDQDQIKFSLNLFEKEGDYLITNLRKVGLGILTADCLPLVFYDPVNHAIAIIHAGWKGLVAGIISKVIEEMKKHLNTDPANLHVFFGPCAKVCCYQVQDDFLKNLENSTFSNQVILHKENKMFFDLPRFATLQLLETGIKSENLKKNYKSCTICDTRFHSHRREGEKSGRQATIVALK